MTRARRVHDGFAKEMTHAAVEQFLPAIVAGVLLTAVLVEAAPQSVWMLPGLWEVIFSLGIFASCRFLPRPMFAVGLWYLAAGLACLCDRKRVTHTVAVGHGDSVRSRATAGCLRLTI